MTDITPTQIAYGALLILSISYLVYKVAIILIDMFLDFSNVLYGDLGLDDDNDVCTDMKNKGKSK